MLTVLYVRCQTCDAVPVVKTLAGGHFDREKTAQMRLNEKAGEETGEEVQKISQLKHQFEQQEQKRLKELSVSNNS